MRICETRSRVLSDHSGWRDLWNIQVRSSFSNMTEQQPDHSEQKSRGRWKEQNTWPGSKEAKILKDLTLSQFLISRPWLQLLELSFTSFNFSHFSCFLFQVLAYSDKRNLCLTSFSASGLSTFFYVVSLNTVHFNSLFWSKLWIP